MLISAVLCTHNRARYLKKALESLTDQTLTPDNYDIIVVDNRSTDATQEVVKSFSRVRPVRYIYEPALGLARARNAGWRSAIGKYVAYLDDDAVASPAWLKNIINVFETVVPRPGCVGGKTCPIWEGQRPEWLPDDLLPALSVVDWSETPHFMTELSAEWLVGTNIAFPLEVLQALGGFAPGLDRVGTRLLSGGDLFLERQILEAGYPCFYDPQIVVGHHIMQSRLQKNWFLQRFYWQGISDAAMQTLKDKLSLRTRFSLAALKTKQLMLSPGAVMSLVLPTSDPGRFRRKCFGLIRLGQIRGLLFSPTTCQ
jgi:glucosyl-dolichyl phosphate glucuronosyltransferase